MIFSPENIIIKDSGERRVFASGAVRDIAEGKGRCDLLPLDVVGVAMGVPMLCAIEEFINTGDVSFLYVALREAITAVGYTSHARAMLEVSKHFEAGAKKYDDNNWRKGIPVKCYIDSAVRHYLKYTAGEEDEPHDRATIWNILCAIWTCENKAELNEYKGGEIND